MSDKKHVGTKDSAKCSFYKSQRKKGLENEEIKKLWIAKKLVELQAKEKADAEVKAAAQAKADAQAKYEAEKKAKEAEKKAKEEADALAKLEEETKKEG